MKPFHTLDEQVEKLKSRELIVDDVDFAKSILSKENYYNVVNGYKKPFLKRDLGGALLQPEEYDSNEKVDTSEMAQIVKAVNLFRNVCAHEEILFLFKLNTKLKSTLFTKYFKSGAINQEKIEKSDLFALVAVLKLVTQKEEYISFIDNIDTLFSLYREKFKSVNFDKIIFLSGFHPNWKNEILESI